MNEKFIKSEEDLKKGVENSSEDLIPYLELGKFYLEQKRFDEALSVYVKITEKFSENFIALMNIGSIYYYKGDYNKAIDYYSIAAENDISTFELHFNLGNAYAETRNIEKALSSYKKAEKINPRAGCVQNAIGMLFRDMGKHVEALAYYKKAVKLEPDSEKYLKNLAFAAQKADLREEAIYYLKEYIKKFGETPLIYLCLANNYKFLKNIDDARGCFDKALELNPDYYNAIVSYAVFSSEFETPEKTLNLFDKALNQRPYDINVYMLKADFLVSEGKDDEALSLYETASKIKTEADIYIKIANIFALKSDYSKALYYCKKAVNERPLDKEYKLVYYETLNKYITEIEREKEQC